MLRYKKLSKNPRQFLAMTAFTVAEFQALLPYFEIEFNNHVAVYRLDGKVRQKRRYRPYKNSVLPTIEDKLLFILVYLKQNSLQEAHASLFGLHQPDANRWIHCLHRLLNQALAALLVLPARTAISLNLAEADSGLYFHDGTERPIGRPTDPTSQRDYYSGKKKQHTLKNILLVHPSGRVLLLSQTAEGKKHDKKVADEAAYTLPVGSVLVQDSGFQGFSLVGVVILQPQKKPRGQELAAEAKRDNQLIAQIRIRVEHAIGGVKRYRMVKDKIRTWKENFRDQVMETCCGLHNFRLDFRPWHYDNLTI
jgi:hypothetical protein